MLIKTRLRNGFFGVIEVKKMLFLMIVNFSFKFKIDIKIEL